MNLLFVNYGDFTTNSLNHIGGFANALCGAGHACVVAVPQGDKTLAHIRQPLFIAATYDDVLTRPGIFPDGKPADVIHAWTPREGVRKFVLAYQRTLAKPARLIVHLEDNERFLLEAFTGKTFADLREAPEAEIDTWLVDGLPHPLRHESFLRVADGITHIVEALKAHVPAGTPTLLLPPGVDFSLYRPQAADPALRAELGLREGERAVVFTGSNTFANEPEMRELYVAIALLNQRGTPTRLVRTGIPSPKFAETLTPELRQHVLDLGFVKKAQLPQLLALADVLVQPGRAGPFNDLRLPSKLPEFLAMGRAVVLPPTNLALLMQDGREAVFLRTGTPDEIANTLQQLFADPARRAALGEKGLAFARQHFDLAANTAALGDFYTACVARSPMADWSLARAPFSSETTMVFEIARRSTSSATDLELVARLTRQADTEIERLKNSPEIALKPLNERIRALSQHAAQLQKTLDEKTRATDRHVENLEEALRLTQTHATNLEKIINQRPAHRTGNVDTILKSSLLQQCDAYMLEVDRLEAQVKEFRTRDGEIERLGALVRSYQTRDGEIELLKVALDRAKDQGLQLQAKIATLEFKVRRMQESFSWRATTWLRALRRVFFKNTPAPAVSEPAARTATAQGRTPVTVAPSSPEAPKLTLEFSVDYPQAWSFPPKVILIRGWCLALEKDVQFKHVRAVLGDRPYPGVYGLKRLDVLAAKRDLPQAEYCGWKIEVAVRNEDSEIVLEAADDSGNWIPFFKTRLRVGEEYAGADLTSYERWAKTFDTPTPEGLKVLPAKTLLFRHKPLISIIVPVYNTPERWLVKAIESVRAQTYTNWELCLADDASPAPHVRPLLEKMAAADPRIKVVFREKNGHISLASNSALELATGEYIGLLDHDDELVAHGLHEIVTLLNAQPNTDLIYSDEDKIDEEGRRHEPYFKPDWLPDLFRGQNYISHFTVYRARLVREVGGFRAGFEGSQDWDLALRVIERIADETRIRHIPKILYHWRAIPGSTALMLSEKNYPLQAARRALTEHFARQGEKVTLHHVPGDHWRVQYPLPEIPPLVSLIIPTRNGLKFLQRGIDSILAKTTYPNYEILIVDNGSDEDATLAYLQSLNEGSHPVLRQLRTAAESRPETTRPRVPNVRVVRYDAPFNYSAINNFAVTKAEGELIGLLNNDLEVITPGWLDEMASQALRPGVGCVGAMLYYPNDRIQHAGVIVGLGGVAGHAFRDFPRGTEGRFNRARLVQNYSAVTAACLVIRKSIYEQVGGLDEKSLAVAFNDIDFCLKVRAAGYRNVWTPFAELYHHESVTRGADDTPEKHERFRSEVETMLNRWPGPIQHDPAYNPNLSLEQTDFSLSHPPRPWDAAPPS